MQRPAWDQRPRAKSGPPTCGRASAPGGQGCRPGPGPLSVCTCPEVSPWIPQGSLTLAPLSSFSVIRCHPARPTRLLYTADHPPLKGLDSDPRFLTRDLEGGTGALGRAPSHPGTRPPGRPFPFQVPEPCGQRRGLLAENSENPQPFKASFRQSPPELLLGRTPQATWPGIPSEGHPGPP